MNTEQLIRDAADASGVYAKATTGLFQRIVTTFLRYAKGQGYELLKADKWIRVEDRLPVHEDGGKRISKRCFFRDVKGNVDCGYYYPKKFKQCEWSDFDFDPDEYEDYHIEEIDGEVYLKEGWWSDYEHMGESYEKPVFQVVEYMEVKSLKASPPKTEL